MEKLCAPANELHILFAGAQVTDIYIGGEVAAGQMADMYGAIGIGEGSCYQISLKIHAYCTRFEAAR